MLFSDGHVMILLLINWWCTNEDENVDVEENVSGSILQTYILVKKKKKPKKYEEFGTNDKTINNAHIRLVFFFF